MDRVLLTGGFGYIGSHTAALLADKGKDFLIYDDFSNSHPSIVNRLEKTINTKGRVFKIINFYQGVVRLNFNQLCDQNLGAEDYLNLSQICKHVFIEEIPDFNEFNSNQQLRFITLIDIFYEKKISLTLSIEQNLNELSLKTGRNIKCYIDAYKDLFEKAKKLNY